MALSCLVPMFLFFSGHATQAEVGVDACRTAIADVRAPRLACDLPYSLDAEERERISVETLGMIQDLRCAVAIDIAKQEFARMMAKRTWEVPTQSAKCQIETSAKQFGASFTLAPIVQFSGNGQAYAAELNVNEARELPPMIAKALMSYFNTNPALEDRFLESINANMKLWIALLKLSPQS